MSYINIEIPPPPKKKKINQKKDTLFSHTRSKKPKQNNSPKRKKKHAVKKWGIGFQLPPNQKRVNKNPAFSRKADPSGSQPLPKEVEEMLAASLQDKKRCWLNGGGDDGDFYGNHLQIFLCFWMENIFFFGWENF